MFAQLKSIETVLVFQNNLNELDTDKQQLFLHLTIFDELLHF